MVWSPPWAFKVASKADPIFVGLFFGKFRGGSYFEECSFRAWGLGAVGRQREATFDPLGRGRVVGCPPPRGTGSPNSWGGGVPVVGRHPFAQGALSLQGLSKSLIGVGGASQETRLVDL